MDAKAELLSHLRFHPELRGVLEYIQRLEKALSAIREMSIVAKMPELPLPDDDFVADRSNN